MSWFILVVAGLFEVVWASSLKRAHEPLFLGITVVTMGVSVGLLAVAVREIPLGVAYAVWTGIGVVGTVAVSVGIYGQVMNAGQWLFLGLLAAGIVGLKATTPHAEAEPHETLDTPEPK